MRIISEYYSDDFSKKSIVKSDSGEFLIEKYQNDALIEIEKFEKNKINILSIIEDKAEDWIYGK